MGTEVGRIEKEFVFKSLVDDGAECDLHGTMREFRCTFADAANDRLALAPVKGTTLEGFVAGEEVRVFFYLKNNYHTFTTRVLEFTPARIDLEPPPGVYKNLQRKYERVKLKQAIDVSFSLHGTKVELNFPKSDRFSPVEPVDDETFNAAKIQDVVKAFRIKMETLVSDSKIVMLRDKMPRSWEEKTLVRLAKSLWIPSTAEDFPSRDPFPDERVITKGELMKLEEESGSLPYVVTSKLGNILYEKTKADIVSELWCPVLYNEYVVGYVRIWNTSARRERITRDLIEYVQQFTKVLCYSLVANGYFKVENNNERRFEAPIIDMSASGLLFAHTSPDLVRDLLVHTDIDINVRVDRRNLTIGSRVMRKFRDAEYAYFGVLFLRIEQEDFEFLFQYLYGKPFDPATEGRWEGGAPPPPLDIS